VFRKIKGGKKKKKRESDGTRWGLAEKERVAKE
jgi:hypothetical protein